MEPAIRKVRPVRVGGLTLGDGTVTVQSMLSAPSTELAANVAQARALSRAGCELIRVAVPDEPALALIPALKQAVAVPIVADIHFDYRLALGAVERGADKIRLNPGNIGGADRVKAVAAACRARGIPIRVGVNAGSLEPSLLEKYGAPTPEALVESALCQVRLLERQDFGDIVISIKSSHVKTMVEAYRLLAARCSYPLHLGVTEAGAERMGTLKNAVGIGALLLDGIGDTIRVSLTADPTAEVRAGFDILRATGVRRRGPELISCPCCGRARIDLPGLAARVEAALAACEKPITVAVMGCAVNGPGEAREADVGLAGGDGKVLLFARGQIVRAVPEEEALPALLAEIERL